MSDIFVPGIIVFVISFSCIKGVDVFSVFCRGALSGLSVIKGILPAMLLMTVAAQMLDASGFLDMLGAFLKPVTDLMGLPGECLPLMFIRPISGSAALSEGMNIMQRCTADSFAGKTAAVMLGASETGLYVLGIYRKETGAKAAAKAVPAMLAAALAAFLSSAFFVRIFLP